MKPRKRQKSKLEEKRERLERKKRYGNSWNAIRKKVYERDGNRCRACGVPRQKGKKLNAHHILLLRVSKTNDDRNLVTLCDSCHKIIEEKALKILKSGGHRVDVVRATHRWLIEMRAVHKQTTEEEPLNG